MDTLKEINQAKEIASMIDDYTKNVRLEACKLVREFENELTNPHSPINIHDLDQRYQKKNEMYYLNDFQSEEGFKQIVATGAVPVDDRIKAKLVMIEFLYPKISEAYRKFDYVDEVWYLDKQSVGGGNTRKNLMPMIQPGFDIGGEYERGEKPYSRFGIIGPDQNPERKAIWSPDAFLELFDEFIISVQSPVYVKNEFIGKISLHINLIDLREAIIAKNHSNLMIISNQYTLIGMSPSVQAITHFTQYEKKSWDSKKAKIEYVNNELNLAKKNSAFIDKIRTLEPGSCCEYEFSNHNYRIFKQEISEIGFQLLVFI